VLELKVCIAIISLLRNPKVKIVE